VPEGVNPTLTQRLLSARPEVTFPAAKHYCLLSKSYCLVTKINGLNNVPGGVIQWCGLRQSVLGQDRSETKKSVLVLQLWCCFVKHDLVTLVVIMIWKDTATFQVLFIVSLFCAWNITTACGDHQWRSLTWKLNPRSAFIYFRWSWS